MSPRADALLAEVLQLPADDRDEFIERLLDAAGPPGSDIDRMTDAEFAAELERRAEEARRDPSALIPWDQVRDMR
jgi:putative addiction module component (TIGR02574 family)